MTNETWYTAIIAMDTALTEAKKKQSASVIIANLRKVAELATYLADGIESLNQQRTEQ